MSTTTHAPHADRRAAPQFMAVMGHAVRDRLPVAGVAAVIVAGLAIMTGSLWPSLQETFADLPESLADTLDTVLAGADLTTPAGWMNAETLSAVAPMAAIAVPVISVVRAVAGEEQGKTLGVLLSAPVSRTTFVLAKAAAMVVHVAVVVVGLAVGLVAGSWVGDLGLSGSGVIGACVHLGVLGVFFGGVALLASAATGDRRLSSAISAGLAGLAFALSAFLPLSDALADGARISPWYYFSHTNPLATGIDVSDVLVLVVGAALMTGAAVVVHRRRDLRG